MSELKRQLEASLTAAGVKSAAPTREPELLAAERAAMPMKSLVTKLAEVMAAVERVPKRGRNDFHKYDYATEADIVATVRQELAKRHVMLVPSVQATTREPVGEKGSVLTVLEMTFTFLDGDSGETLARSWFGCGSDKDDKGLYKAMTGGEKYFLLKTFLIPTGDDPERDDSKPVRKSVATPDPPETVLDAQTGEAVSAANRPKAPQGYYYIDAYTADGAWHHVVFNGLKSDGSALLLKTKLPLLGATARDAYQFGIPVKFTWKPNDKPKEEGWLNKIEKWSLEREAELHTLPVEASEIPFGG